MKIVSAFIVLLLFCSLIVLPEQGSAQPVPFEGCCQFVDSCENLSQDACIADATSMEFFINEECSPSSRFCPSFILSEPEVSNVPTLSQWGLIALAGVMGIMILMVIRRRQARA